MCVNKIQIQAHRKLGAVTQQYFSNINLFMEDHVNSICIGHPKTSLSSPTHKNKDTVFRSTVSSINVRNFPVQTTYYTYSSNRHVRISLGREKECSVHTDITKSKNFLLDSCMSPTSPDKDCSRYHQIWLFPFRKKG
jgi:hypothetical protein